MGFELHSALQLQSGAETKELPFSFLWERKGFYLRSVAPSSPKPSPTPLHVRGGDIALLTQSVASLVNFDGVKFINLTSNFNVKR